MRNSSPCYIGDAIDVPPAHMNRADDAAGLPHLRAAHHTHNPENEARRRPEYTLDTQQAQYLLYFTTSRQP